MLEYHTFSTQIPFAQLGIDLLGPFPKAISRKHYLIVAFNYFTRWVEVKALASITTKKIKEFFYEDVICCFRIHKILICDSCKKFDSKEHRKFCEDLGIE